MGGGGLYIYTQPAIIKSSIDMEEVQTPKNKQKKFNSNHFLCIRINDERVKKNVIEVQEKILQKDERFKDSVTPPERFHMTLAVMQINDDETKTQIIKILEELCPKLRELLMNHESKSVLIKNLGTFRDNKILYCKTEKSKVFDDFINILRDHLNGIKGIMFNDNYHMTIIKPPYKSECFSLSSDLYKEFEDKEFGSIPLNNLNLSRMGEEEKEDDGFYHTIKKIVF